MTGGHGKKFEQKPSTVLPSSNEEVLPFIFIRYMITKKGSFDPPDNLGERLGRCLSLYFMDEKS